MQTDGAHTVFGIGGFKRMDRICAEREKKIAWVPSSGPFSEYIRLQNCVSCTSNTKSSSSLSCCLTAWYFKSLARFGDWNTFFNLGVRKITLVYLAFRDQTFFLTSKYNWIIIIIHLVDQRVANWRPAAVMSATRHENSRLPPKYQEPSKTKRTALNLTLTPSPDFRKRKENSFLGSSNRISAFGCSTCSPVRGGNIRVLLCSSWAGIFTRFLFHTPPKRNQNNKRKTYREIYGAKGVNKVLLLQCYC